MISVKNLTKYYGDVKALDNISFDIEHGEIVGILGPNGAGKSTTLRIITSFLSQTSGSIFIDDKDIENNQRSIKKIIGYLPESAPLYNDMIVYDYLVYIAKIQDVEPDKLEERLEYVIKSCSLAGVIEKSISTLSKGFKQRVGIAGSIIHNPKILILDEPTNGLDPNQIVEIRELIKSLGKEKTVLLSTHILSEVEATCGRVIIINKGKIITDSSTEDLILNKTGGVSILLSIKTNDNEENIEKMLKNISTLQTIKFRNSNNNVKNITLFLKESDTDPRDEVYSLIKKTDWVIYEMSKEKEDLESIFRTLTKGDNHE